MEEIKTLPDVAKRIFLDCKKCNCGRYHVVVAHLNSTSAKVECEVCKSKKTFKLEKRKAKKSTRSSGPERSSRMGPGKQLDKFNELKQKWASEGQVTPYKMTLTFGVNMAIEHPKFGLGFITGVGGQSIQVTFQDEDRSLVHGRT